MPNQPSPHSQQPWEAQMHARRIAKEAPLLEEMKNWIKIGVDPITGKDTITATAQIALTNLLERITLGETHPQRLTPIEWIIEEANTLKTNSPSPQSDTVKPRSFVKNPSLKITAGLTNNKTTGVHTSRIEATGCIADFLRKWSSFTHYHQLSGQDISSALNEVASSAQQPISRSAIISETDRMRKGREVGKNFKCLHTHWDAIMEELNINETQETLSLKEALGKAIAEKVQANSR